VIHKNLVLCGHGSMMYDELNKISFHTASRSAGPYLQNLISILSYLMCATCPALPVTLDLSALCYADMEYKIIMK
jgi:hypothetical protein